MKYLSFGTLLLVIILLMTATVVEKLFGTNIAIDYIYTSPAMIALWGILAISALVYMIKCKLLKRVPTFLLHVSFVVILCGALSTHILGEQGKIHLRQESGSIDRYTLNDGSERQMPFSVKLDSFKLEYYTGSTAPMDYVSVLTVDGSVKGVVSMNNVFSYDNYRFYQSSYDSDGLGTTLLVSHDPIGIGITYTGYALLLLSMLLFFGEKNSGFRTLLRSRRFCKSLAIVSVIVLSGAASEATAENRPSSLPQSAAESFGKLYVYYNNRICPMQTLARDFTIKLYGQPSYKGMTAEQVLTGFLFYYDEWKNEPVIKIKGENAQKVLGIDGKYARLIDFIDISGFKIENALINEQYFTERKNLEIANEKFNLVSMVATGSLLKIYPYDSGNGVEWFSLADKLPSAMPTDEWTFVRRSMDYVAEMVAMDKYDEVESLLSKIRKHQSQKAERVIPSESDIRAEMIYNSSNANKPIAMVCLLIGVVLFIVVCVSARRQSRILSILSAIIMIGVLAYLTMRIALRWYIGGHIPLSNGFETMQFMAWVVAVITLIAHRRLYIAMSFGYILIGLTMLVAMMGESNPQITHLMPVLQSPLLCIHVVLIMIAYAFFAFIMFNGIAALVFHYVGQRDEDVEHLQALSQLMLYPAVFLLALGIFIGAIWANVSWGRYWGWDPKEVWALITLLVYSIALHRSSLSYFRKPVFFHVFSILAFLTVVVTYFGVNFILGGLHGYA